jgi:hypothetical protein
MVNTDDNENTNLLNITEYFGDQRQWYARPIVWWGIVAGLFCLICIFGAFRIMMNA